MDISYGRYLGPHHFGELELEADPSIQTSRRRVFLDPEGNGVGEGHEVKLVKEELIDVHQPWIYYQSWQKTFSDEQASSLPGKGTDIVFVHGLGDSGGRWAKQVLDSNLLDEGFRVWTLDLATHGRSSGTHCHIMEESQLPKSLEAVLVAIASEDRKVNNEEGGGRRRKTFLVGHSLGGWTMFAHSILYPPSSTPPSPTDPLHSHVDGIYAIAPFLGVAAESVPSPIVVAVGKLIRRIKPDFPIENAVRGKQFDHPDVDAEFFADPQPYHGKIRCSTGLSILRMTPFILSPASTLAISNLAIPVKVIHGDADRVCEFQGSVKLVETMNGMEGLGGQGEGEGGEGEEGNGNRNGKKKKGKRVCEVWKGFEHVMFGYGWDGMDEEKKEMRMRLLKDLHDWMVEQAQDSSS